MEDTVHWFKMDSNLAKVGSFQILSSYSEVPTMIDLLRPTVTVSRVFIICCKNKPNCIIVIWIWLLSWHHYCFKILSVIILLCQTRYNRHNMECITCYMLYINLRVPFHNDSIEINFNRTDLNPDTLIEFMPDDRQR